MSSSDSEEEGDVPETAPSSSPCTALGPPPRTTETCCCCCCECKPRACHRGRSTSSLLKGSKRKRGPQTTVGDAPEKELFTLKCLELQCYLPPLSSILRGLKSGRYSERLSSFQQSVAIDRIQRIMGVLQSPRPGLLLRTVVKIEAMLRSWFPDVRDRALSKKQKLWLYCSHDVSPSPLHWPRPLPVSPALSLTQDNAVSSSSDFDGTAPPGDASPLQFSVQSPCLERLLRAKDSLIQTRTEPDQD